MYIFFACNELCWLFIQVSDRNDCGVYVFTPERFHARVWFEAKPIKSKECTSLSSSSSSSSNNIWYGLKPSPSIRQDCKFYIFLEQLNLWWFTVRFCLSLIFIVDLIFKYIYLIGVLKDCYGEITGLLQNCLESMFVDQL